MDCNIQFEHIIPVELFVSQTHELKSITTIGFHVWKHAKGKKGNIIAHDVCASQKQTMYSWSNYTEYFENIHLLMSKQLNPIVII